MQIHFLFFNFPEKEKRGKKFTFFQFVDLFTVKVRVRSKTLFLQIKPCGTVKTLAEQEKKCWSHFKSVNLVNVCKMRPKSGGTIFQRNKSGPLFA